MKLKIGLSAAVVFLAVAGIALATNHGDTVEEVCVNDSNGNMRWDDTCRNHETEVPIGGAGDGTTFYVAFVTEPATPFVESEITASCAAGDSVTGGGFQANNSSGELVDLFETYPSSESSWTVRGRRFTAGNLTAYAVCATS
jgi:hypothetical protein